MMRDVLVAYMKNLDEKLAEKPNDLVLQMRKTYQSILMGPMLEANIACLKKNQELVAAGYDGSDVSAAMFEVMTETFANEIVQLCVSSTSDPELAADLSTKILRQMVKDKMERLKSGKMSSFAGKFEIDENGGIVESRITAEELKERAHDKQ